MISKGSFVNHIDQSLGGEVIAVVGNLILVKWRPWFSQKLKNTWLRIDQVDDALYLPEEPGEADHN